MAAVRTAGQGRTHGGGGVPPAAATMVVMLWQHSFDWPRVWGHCWDRIRRWRVPSHRHPGQWHEEITALAVTAAWEAVARYEAAYGLPRDVHAQRRILERVLQRYREEWRAGRVQIRAELPEVAAADGVPDYEDQEALDHALATLPAEEREFILLAFSGETQARIAAEVGKTQSWVCKHKSELVAKVQAVVEKSDTSRGGRWQFTGSNGTCQNISG